VATEQPPLGTNLSTVDRRRAVLAHLAVTVVVVGVVCAAIFFVWYPAPYFDAMGASGVLRVLIGVSLVVGPVLTWVVFKPGKWGLKFDLWCIGLVQLAALAYGTITMYRERPYFIVFAVDRFHVLPRTDVEAAGLAAPDLAARIGTKPAIGPLLVAASLPADDAGMQRLIADLVAGKPDIEHRPEFWGRYQGSAAAVMAHARPVAELFARRPEATRALAELAAARALPRERLGFLPLIARNRDMSLVVDLASGTPVGIVDADPWLESNGRTAALE
jgi:hypothetical protein